MKRNLLCATIGATALAALFSVSAGAQTCAAPASWTPDAGGNPVINDTTCGHETGIVGTCQTFTAPAAAYVAQIDVAAAGTFTDITFTGGAGYTIAAYLVPSASGCNANAPCTTTGDGTTHMLHGDIPPGNYYLIVTGADFDASGACGTFTMQANGTLPVTLQSFTVG
ncbi:hypothetical protein [Dokdonella fugitiva]|jgi:hypothetical protein|uniref:Pre-peptidase n=1 Tax=Dokdonella fugitiva TaxID=328517 RepID=A0A4R2IBM2_9GAMM|nr:hypothetical protein [Dokdonella fugitiva]MBA8883936.1 hypothetical protein [Dokdonella fugitiva]TCO41924.1 hypothetical protein EV148_102278 [Dokdonella fugitiva]